MIQKRRGSPGIRESYKESSTVRARETFVKV